MEREIRALIVDDDLSARNILQKFMELADNVIIVKSVDNTISGMEVIDTFKPDVIFLDINMPNEDGLQFAQRIRNKKIDIEIIFTTAYKNYAAEAFYLKPLDFLVKPFDLNDVFDVITKIENHIDENVKLASNDNVWGGKIPDKIKIKIDSGLAFVDPENILFFQMNNMINKIYFVDGESERVFHKISELVDMLKDHSFLRANRSTLVNLKYIEQIVKSERVCIIKGKLETINIPVSASVYKYMEKLNLLKLG